MMEKKDQLALILLNGDPSFFPFAEEVKKARNHFFLIAVDGGAQELAGTSLLPDLLLGDMDSLHHTKKEAFLQEGVPLDLYPTNKDKTDGQLALEKARDLGFQKLLFFGALGGRIDQVLANIQLLHLALFLHLKGGIISQTEYLFGFQDSISFMAPKGTSFSLLSFTSKVRGLSITGSAYDVKEVILKEGDTLGLSNLVYKPPVTIRTLQGKSLLILEGKKELKPLFLLGEIEAILEGRSVS